MRIAQVAPLFEPVPPRGYGGSERVVSWLTEELVALGHAVTLFATGDSDDLRAAIPVRPFAERFARTSRRTTRPYARMLELVRRQAAEFDVLHFHIDFHPFSLFTRQPTPFLTTLHGRLDQDWVPDIYDLFPEMNLVSVSDAQRLPMPGLNWVATVCHGVPPNLLHPQPGGGDYFAFLGRMSRGEGHRDAIRIAADLRREAEGRREDRRGRSSLLSRSRRPAARRQGRRISRRDHDAESRPSSPAPARCCSRSPGRSRSAWP